MGVDPWTAVQSAVNDGLITLDANAAVTRAVNATADALGTVTAIQKHVSSVHNIGGFGGLGSGQALSSKFAGVAIDLNNVLDQHKQILNTMGQTLYLAGKKYLQAEDDNATSFQQIAKQHPANLAAWPGKLKPWHHPDDGGSIYNKNGKLKQLPALPKPLSQLAKSGKIDPTPVTPDPLPTSSAAGADGWYVQGPMPPLLVENPTVLGYNAFVELGHRINGSSQQIPDASARWSWMSTQLNSAFSALSNHLTELREENLWRGKGADMAVAAGTTYQASIANLASDMQLVSSNLTYTAGWLQTVAQNMPPKMISRITNPTEISAAQQNLNKARVAFQNFYVPGVQNSAAAIPVLPAAESPISGPPSGSSGGSPTSGTGGGGPAPSFSGLGGGGGGGLPAGGGGLPAGGGAGLPDGGDPSLSGDGGEPDGSLPSGYTGVGAGSSPPVAIPTTPPQTTPTSTDPSGTDPDSPSTPTATTSAGLASPVAGLASSASSLPTLSGMPSTGMVPNTASGRVGSTDDRKDGLDGMGGPDGLGAEGLGGGAAGLGSPLDGNSATSAQLFPRASLAPGAGGPMGDPSLARGGMAPMGGMPGSPGMAGRPAEGQGKEHRRPAYLDSTVYLEEAMGEAPVVVKPVVEQ